jgi:NlpC/P60 family
VGNQVERAIAVALSKLGAPYVWATAGPETFDCSGFTWWVASQVLGPQDYELRSSHHQFNVWRRGPQVTGDNPHAGRPGRGDVVFFDTTGAVVFGNRASHVGLMLDEERFVHAANEDLDVRIDPLRGGWYDGKLIGSGRIFLGDPYPNRPEIPETTVTRVLSQPTTLRELRLPRGPVTTPNPWNGGDFGALWTDLARWYWELEAAASEQGIDVRLPAAVMMLETQGIHERDGQVLEVWDHHPQDGPSVGVMQVKPRLWQELVPDANAYEPAGNIRLGVAVLAYWIDQQRGWEGAIANGYHPGVSPNGTTPARYVEAMHGLLGELGWTD